MYNETFIYIRHHPISCGLLILFIHLREYFCFKSFFDWNDDGSSLLLPIKMPDKKFSHLNIKGKKDATSVHLDVTISPDLDNRQDEQPE